jgi:fructose/tagatose bisphosphate aldolase
MRLITERREVMERLSGAGRARLPILCPNAETPDEMEGIMVGTQRYAISRNLKRVVIGIGVTASYPDHPQLRNLDLAGNSTSDGIAQTAETWLGWLKGYSDRPGLLAEVEVIPFLDHGWAPYEADLQLMNLRWFQERVGIIMFDASGFEFETNIRRTAEFVRHARDHVVIEACPDKIYERREIQDKQLDESGLLSRPADVERFVHATGVDLIVPNLGTEHRAMSRIPLEYRHDIARDIANRVGPIQALHGTSSLGRRLGTVGRDGICKVNYYTGMTMAATAALRPRWEPLSGGEALRISEACGSFIHRTRRTVIAENVFQTLQLLERPVK